MNKSLIVWLAFSALIVSCDFIKKQGNQNKQEVAEEFYDARSAAEAETTSNIKNDKAKVTMMEIPAPLKNRPEQIIKRKGYTVSYNKSTKVPNWVAWHLVKSHCYGVNSCLRKIQMFLIPVQQIMIIIIPDTIEDTCVLLETINGIRMLYGKHSSLQIYVHKIMA